MLQAPVRPHVRFETQVQETKDKDGHNVFANVDYAYITPPGGSGKTEHVEVASTWLEKLKEKTYTRGPFDSAAADYIEQYKVFSAMYAQWKAGHEITHNGTPLRASLAFTKAEIAQAESVKIFTIEDLAGCNEDAITRMPMVGRTLKQRAQKILQERASGDVASENEALRLRIASLEEKVTLMVAAGVQEPAERKKPGRKPKAE